jgi:hypothetical protein
LPSTGGTVTGATTFNSSVTINGGSASGYTGYKNRIINGGMSVWQRGTSFASGITTNTYTADRFFVYASGASVAVAQVAGPAGYKYALQITGAASNTSAAAYHRIESLNCIDLSGATVTISVTLTASSTQTVGWALQYPTSSDNYVSAATGISSGTWTATSTATTFTATVTNLPAGVLNGLQLIIGANNFGAFTSGTLQITGVQLERGSNATSFEFRDYGRELIMCQRYFFKGQTFDAIFMGTITTANTYYCNYALPVTMRTSPTLSNVSSNFSTGFNAATLASYVLNDRNIQFAMTSNATIVAGLYYAYANASAEL